MLWRHDLVFGADFRHAARGYTHIGGGLFYRVGMATDQPLDADDLRQDSIIRDVVRFSVQADANTIRHR